MPYVIIYFMCMARHTKFKLIKLAIIKVIKDLNE